MTYKYNAKNKHKKYRLLILYTPIQIIKSKSLQRQLSKKYKKVTIMHKNKYYETKIIKEENKDNLSL